MLSAKPGILRLCHWRGLWQGSVADQMRKQRPSHPTHWNVIRSDRVNMEAIAQASTDLDTQVPGMAVGTGAVSSWKDDDNIAKEEILSWCRWPAHCRLWRGGGGSRHCHGRQWHECGR